MIHHFNLEKELKDQENIIFINVKNLVRQFMLSNIYDDFTEREAKIPYTQPFDRLLSLQILKKIYAAYHNRHKVIAVDCDNTLWTGICC
jgi:predicted enzyme involved in methoxymalonyl-ACP biosynthesis